MVRHLAEVVALVLLATACSDSDPALSSDDSLDTLASDPVYDGHGWTVVGSPSVPGRLPRVPMAWTSPDGESWHREAFPESDAFTDLERVIQVQGGILAAVIRGEEFGTWQRVDGTWEQLGTFGALDPDGGAAPFVSGLTEAGSQVLASISDGSSYRLWSSEDGRDWRPVTTPSTPSTAGEHIMSVSASGGSVLLLADDGETGRVWLAKLG